MVETQARPEPSPEADLVGQRSRTYSWVDPQAALHLLAGLSGREIVEAMAAGTIPVPPIAATLAFGSIEVGDDFVAVNTLAREFHYNPLGAVHGGVISALLDTAAALAVHTTLERGEWHTSLDLNTKFIRPMTVDSGLTRCEGRVAHRGRRTAVAEAVLSDETGRRLAQATSTLLIMDGSS